MCSFSVEPKEPGMFILGSFAFAFFFFFPPFLAAFRSIFPRGHIKGHYVSGQASMGRIFRNSHSLGGRILLLGLKQQLKCFNVQGIRAIDQDMDKCISLMCIKLIFHLPS